MRVGGVQAVNVAQQHQQVGVGVFGNQGTQAVVIAQGVFLGGNRVVFVDDRHSAQLDQAFQRVLQVVQPVGMVKVLPGHQQLGNGVAVFGKQLVVSIHQLALAHGCGGLLCHHIFGAGNLQLAHTKAGCAGRYNNQLVPGVFDVAPHFYQCFGVADVQPPARMGQRAGADLDNNAHQFFPISFVLS